MARYLVVAALFLLSLITYIDRAAISSAKGAVAADLGLSDESMGAVFGAFALGYALAQVPSGWLADRFGPRLALTLVVAIWSVFTGITGLVHTLGAMLTVRFLFGVAEAGAFPGAARAFINWLPTGERGRANGIIFAGARLGAALAFPVMAWLLGHWNWHCYSGTTRPNRRLWSGTSRSLRSRSEPCCGCAGFCWPWPSISLATSLLLWRSPG
jgi:ACS family glucarate transporter-like MFS transporter